MVALGAGSTLAVSVDPGPGHAVAGAPCPLRTADGVDGWIGPSSTADSERGQPAALSAPVWVTFLIRPSPAGPR